MSHATDFSPQDLAQLAERGITPAEAARQLAVMARPAAWADLVRPCTAGDGIRVLDERFARSMSGLCSQPGDRGDLCAFVPASGAATRMFKDLLAARELPGELLPGELRARSDAASLALTRFVDELPRFAFWQALTGALSHAGHDLDALRRDGPWRPVLEGFLGGEGLAAASAPKGQLLFHRDADGARTAFEEHLHEAVFLASDAGHVRRLHVTVSPEHRAGFEALLAECRPRLIARYGGDYSVAFSEQHAATDTIAGDPAGGPFRDESGRLLFRPAGHGALIRNLQACGSGFVFLKNIDNVASPMLRSQTTLWSRALVGYAYTLMERTHAHLAALREGREGAVSKAHEFAADALGLQLDPSLDAAATARALDRPIRVAGMVKNTGEPGGGPFWVRGPYGITPQIVESAQVDPGAAGQMAILRAATHFNPVFIACALRDAAGGVHALDDFVDDSAVIVTRKSHGGRDLLALERPGLWNGAMAHWHTVFVEVPLAVFNPVKTVFDLLRPEHQG